MPVRALGTFLLKKGTPRTMDEGVSMPVRALGTFLLNTSRATMCHVVSVSMPVRALGTFLREWQAEYYAGII